MIAYLRYLARCAVVGGPLGAAAVIAVVVVHEFARDRAARAARTVSASGPHPSRGSDAGSSEALGSASEDGGSPAAGSKPRAAAVGGYALVGEQGPELRCITLDDRLGRYLQLRGHTISTDPLTDHEAIAAQAAYVFGEARELRDAARAFQRDGSVAHLNDVWAEMADVALSVTQLRRTMRRVGVPCPPVEQLIEEKTQADVGRG